MTPNKLSDYFKAFIISGIFPFVFYQRLYSNFKNESFNNSNIFKIRFNSFQYALISIIDNYLIILLYFKILNFYKEKITFRYDSYDQEIDKLFNETVSNERLKKLEVLYNTDDKAKLYLNNNLPIFVLLTGLTCTFIYSPVDYIIQSILYQKSLSNKLFVPDNYQKIIFTVMPNFFRFTVQYGLVIIMNELHKHNK